MKKVLLGRSSSQKQSNSKISKMNINVPEAQEAATSAICKYAGEDIGLNHQAARLCAASTNALHRSFSHSQLMDIYPFCMEQSVTIGPVAW